MAILIACTGAMSACTMRTPFDNSTQPNDASVDQRIPQPTPDTRITPDTPPDLPAVFDVPPDLPNLLDGRSTTPDSPVDLRLDGLADRYGDVLSDARTDLLQDLSPDLRRDLAPDLPRDQLADTPPDLLPDRGPDPMPDLRSDLPPDLVVPLDATCTPWQTLPCTCGDGRSGARTCLPTLTFTECIWGDHRTGVWGCDDW